MGGRPRVPAAVQGRSRGGRDASGLRVQVFDGWVFVRGVGFLVDRLYVGWLGFPVWGGRGLGWMRFGVDEV